MKTPMKLTQGRTNDELFAEMTLRSDSPAILPVIAIDFDHYMRMVDYIASNHLTTEILLRPYE